MAARNAASVLPEPVGAKSSVDAPATSAGQPWACAGVAAGNEAKNHARTGAWKAASGLSAFGTGEL